MTTRDEDIMRGLAAGESEALKALYEKYASLVFGIALRIVGDGRLAEEVAQDVFLSAWKGAGGRRERPPPGSAASRATAPSTPFEALRPGAPSPATIGRRWRTTGPSPLRRPWKTRAAP
jgi:hypothetical protein